MFVGRGDEVERLTAGIDDALAGRGRLFFVSGEPGIGKTRLCDEVAERAAGRGLQVAWGRGWEGGGAPAYWPWIQALREVVGEDGLAQALPELGSDAALAADPLQARFRLFDAVARLLARESRRAPLLVVLDDVHVADVPSLLLLQFVARALRAARIVLVATYRDVEARLAPETGELLAKIARDGEHLSLSRLTREDVATWVATSCDAAEVHRITEGNPLFVGEVLRLGRSQGLSGVIPDGVRAAIRGHLAHLAPDTRARLARASVLGRDLACAEVAQACGCGRAAARESLEQGVAAGVVTARGGEFVFAHALFGEELYRGLAEEERARTHWSVGERLAADGAEARAAHHLIEGLSAGDPERMLRVATAAAERAMATLAFEDAARLLERALAAVDTGVSEAQRCALHLGIAEARIFAGDDARGKASCVRAAAIARALGDAELLARAALVYGTEIVPISRDETMVELLRAALAALPTEDSPTRARVMARLAAAVVPLPNADDPEPTTLAREGVAMARRTGDREALLHALRWSAASQPFAMSAEDRLTASLEQAELAVSLGKKVAAIPPLIMGVCEWLDLGDVERADQTQTALAARLAELPQPHYRWRLPALRAMRATMSGRFDEAERDSAEVRAIFQGLDGAQRNYVLIQMFGLEHARRDGRLLAGLDEMLRTHGGGPAAPFRAWVQAASGRTAEAAATLRGAIPFMVLAGVPSVTGVLGDACVLAGAVDAATALYERGREILPRGRLMWGPGGVACLGPLARTLGDLAAMLGREDEAVLLYADALDLCERIGARAYAAHVQLAHGALLARRGDPGAGVMLRRAASTAEACGIDLVASRAAALLAGTPAAVPTAPPAGAPPTIAIARDGELWRVTSERGVLRFKDARGLHFLAHLVAHPHQEFHVSQLGALGSGEVGEAGDAGAMLDAAAKEKYARRVEDLRDVIEEATSFGDRTRAARARVELDAIAGELARAVGLGGRDRKAASQTERARINVQRRLKDAIQRVREQDPALGGYLEASVKTGTYCQYAPPWTGRDG